MEEDEDELSKSVKPEKEEGEEKEEGYVEVIVVVANGGQLAQD
jgi:hypothetical protein